MKYTTGAVYKLINKKDENDMYYLHLLDYDLIVCRKLDLASLFPSDIEFCDILTDRELRISSDVKKIIEDCEIEKLDVQRIQITEIEKVTKNVSCKKQED
ncbi:hypothetical protein [Cetobacterium sp.]|uniref:hypothetical protein n=1 Tax=Cetobacterium sp. TaxID=2071632 RepID=UPI003F321AB8